MRTTININNELLKKLQETSEALNLSISDLITIFINKIIRDNIFDIALFQCVKYQEIDPNKNWKKQHVYLESQIYEKGLDLRKIFKVSVSLIVAFSIVNLLEEIVEEIKSNDSKKQKVDNYPLNYTFITRMFNNIEGYVVFWGLPEKKHLKNFIP